MVKASFNAFLQNPPRNGWVDLSLLFFSAVVVFQMGGSPSPFIMTGGTCQQIGIVFSLFLSIGSSFLHLLCGCVFEFFAILRIWAAVQIERKIKVFRGIHVGNNLGIQRGHDFIKHFLVAGERSAEAFIHLCKGKVVVAGMRLVRSLINEVFGNRLSIVITVEERGK